ncbi:NAD(P)-dependent alcohol dehydrogenase [Isoalcanivorax indicus]|uniref:NAD(P)-dependent alcohol dehydrogenase n=1 Tax=Isoalcanivorax indicus TaxID=2202653 RepID=UPI000DB9A49F|nr:NAD(P)-dependent alcohol dehydrogenase [Isoalcanivorax indicus]
MKAIVTSGLGPRAPLVIGDVARPRPGRNDLLVAVQASSVNPKDWKLNRNIAAVVPRLGGALRTHLFGDDLSGIVVDKGRAVTGFKVGDAVYGMDMRLRTNACAEFAVIDQRRVAHKPANLSHEQAAAVPLAAQTALQAFRKAGVGSGTRLLIIGASGGVGTFAIQIGKALGAEVTGVCSHRNLELVRQLGADAVIDYTAEDYLRRDDDFDVVFDATSHESPDTCASLLKPDGIFVTTGGYLHAYLNVARRKLLRRGVQAKLVIVESWTHDLETLTQWIEAGRITPVIDSLYPMENLDAAYQHSKSGRARGKIVVQVGSDTPTRGT